MANELGAHSSADKINAPLQKFMELDAVAEALGNLAIGSEGKLKSFIGDVETHGEIDGTEYLSHCHFIELDPNGLPGTDRLIDYLVQKVTKYAIPAAEIQKARKYLDETNDPQELNKLYEEAKSLFTKISNSGEGGELLLYLLADEFLNLPQLICKMDLKTSTQMHYHGADGVHVGFDKKLGKLCLYWGESKIHSDVGKAISDCFDSIAPFMLDPVSLGSTQAREFQHILRRIDFSDLHLEDALKNMLDPQGEHFMKLDVRAICLVGFDEDSYPNVVKEKESQQLREELLAKLPAWKKRISSKAKNAGVERFVFHVFCVPFPSVEFFRKRLLEKLKV